MFCAILQYRNIVMLLTAIYSLRDLDLYIDSLTINSNYTILMSTLLAYRPIAKFIFQRDWSRTKL